MATLVQFLAAGVKGAESGSATFVLRGTASSAATVLYNDFEEVAQPGTNIITLDANGAAEVYSDAYCDVTLKNSAGATLRTVTIGNSAPLVEVRSTSFKGTDYDGSPANTVNNPITLKAILDKWITSAGSPDWQVPIAGVATNLQTAFAGLAGMFTNVKDPQYGAVGDGITNDTTAILAATTAANGGVVFFPPGTYKITTLSLSGASINWMGCGAGASIISGTTSTTLIGLTNNTNTAWKNFSGLSFSSSGSYTRLFLLEESQNVSFSKCVLDGALCSSDIIERASVVGLSKYLFTDCDFILGAATLVGILNGAPTASAYTSIRGCNFKVPSGFTGTILLGAGFEVQASRFDASLVTSGAYHHISTLDSTVAGKYVGAFTGNTFLDGGSSGYAFDLRSAATNCDFSEGNNVFIGFTAPAAVTDAGHIYDCSNAAGYNQTSRIHLGSRQGKQLFFTDVATAGDVLNIKCFLIAETITINETSNILGSYYMDPAAQPTGLKWMIVVLNNTGSTKNVIVGGTANTLGGSVLNGGRGMFSLFSYLEAAGSTDADLIAFASSVV